MLFYSIQGDGCRKFSQSPKVLMTKYVARVQRHNIHCLIWWPIILPRSTQKSRTGLKTVRVWVCVCTSTVQFKWEMSNREYFINTFQTSAISAQFIQTLSNTGKEVKWQYCFSLNSPFLNFDLELMILSWWTLPYLATTSEILLSDSGTNIKTCS